MTTSISLPPYPGLHSGTGYFNDTRELLVPASLPGVGALAFSSHPVAVRTMLFQVNASQPVVPKWIGVAVPDKVTDFGKPNIFFHPIPAQAGYKDSDYDALGGMWPQLFYYMERLGFEVDGAIKYFGAPSNQIVIMPFLTTGAVGTTGTFRTNWFELVTDILTQIRDAIAGKGSLPVTITEVVLSSFSVGLTYGNVFRQFATGLSPLLRQVWNFDGYPKGTSSALQTTPQFKVIKYDQLDEPGAIHVPFSRWSAYPNPPGPNDPNPWLADQSDPHYEDTHHLIRSFMFLDAATKR